MKQLSPELYNALISYLASCPWGAVHKLIRGLEEAPIQDQEKIKASQLAGMMMADQNKKAAT